MTASKTVATAEQTQTEMFDSDFADFGMSGRPQVKPIKIVDFVDTIKLQYKKDVFKFVIYCNKNQMYSAQVIAIIVAFIDEDKTQKELKINRNNIMEMFGILQVSVSDTKSHKIPNSTFMKIIGNSTKVTSIEKETNKQFDYVPVKYFPVDETNEKIMKIINFHIKKYNIEVVQQAELNEINIVKY